jgi:hypothetical protein
MMKLHDLFLLVRSQKIIFTDRLTASSCFIVSIALSESLFISKFIQS